MTPPAVDQRRVAADANQAAPGPDAHDWPELGLAEQPGQRVAARARHLIDDHHLRAIDAARRLDLVVALARRVGHARRSLEVIDDVVGDAAAVIETFVDDDAVLAHL